MNPEDSRFFENDDQSQDATQLPLSTYFPTFVIEGLRASSVPPPVQFSQYLKRLETEPEVEESFTLDLFRLLGDEDGFDWPLDDLSRCLTLSVFRSTRNRA
jgi:hypothetical protein